MTTEKMTTEKMTRFLTQVSEAHKKEFVVMVLDGASISLKQGSCYTRRCGTGTVAVPYSPELNPGRKNLEYIARNYFANRVFESLDAATAQAEFGLTEMGANKSAVRKLTK